MPLRMKITIITASSLRLFAVMRLQTDCFYIKLAFSSVISVGLDILLKEYRKQQHSCSGVSHSLKLEEIKTRYQFFKYIIEKDIE